MLQAGVIDVHAHYLPPAVLELFPSAEMGPAVFAAEEGRVLMVNGYRMVRQERRMADAEERLQEMDRAGIAVQLLSPNPIFFHYWDEPERAARLARVMNDGLAAAVGRFPHRFLGLATVPLQDVDLALGELDRAVTELGLIGVEIGSHINGKDLDDPALEPFFAEVERRSIPVQVHPTPHEIAGRERMGRYHLRNLIGNLVETSIAVAGIIFGGVLDRHPGLRIAFAHGGGLAPYQIGRWEHGLAVRPEARLHISGGVMDYFRQCWFDSIVHSDAALAYLIEAAGPGRVLLGTDYPADMADLKVVERLGRLTGDAGLARAVATDNALAWLGLNAEAAAPAQEGQLQEEVEDHG